VSLPPPLWDALGVDRTAVRARARFFAGFTKLQPPPYDRRALADLLASTEYRPPDRPVIDLLNRQDETAQALLRELPPAGPPAAPDRWVPAAERADALRQAAIAELLLNAEAGRMVLRRASSEYTRLGLPFGEFLTVAASGEPVGPSASAHLTRLLGLTGTEEMPADLGSEAALLSPQDRLAAPEQQLYLLLAAAADAPRWGSGFLAAIATARQATQPAAVGALVQPLSVWWETGRLIAEIAAGNAEVRPSLRNHLADLARAHGRQLGFAQQDEFHWRRAVARVDLVDLDLAGTVAQSVRVLQRRQLPRWNVREEFGELSPLAQVSITVGLRLGDGGDVAYEDAPWNPDPSPLATEESAEWHAD